MITRNKVLSQAVDECMKELYSLAQPSVDWEEFVKENKIYSEKFEVWEKYNRAKNLKEKEPDKWEIEKKFHPDWEDKSITECIGPRPYEFYYLPREVFKEVCDSYVEAYRMNSQQNLLDIIQILKNYCKEPIVDKYIEGKGKPGDDDYDPGHRGYEHPDNLVKELYAMLKMYCNDSEADLQYVAEESQNKFFEFMDMAGDFFCWNRDLHAFNTAVYLGASPCSNKQAVIDNWKIYRKQKIKIDDDKYNEEQDYD